jgi:hypothetical protein
LVASIFHLPGLIQQSAIEFSIHSQLVIPIQLNQLFAVNWNIEGHLPAILGRIKNRFIPEEVFIITKLQATFSFARKTKLMNRRLKLFSCR